MPNDGEDIGQRDWLDDDCVLPFLVWVRQYSGLSEATCRRITQPGGGGPSLVRLSRVLGDVWYDVVCPAGAGADGRHQADSNWFRGRTSSPMSPRPRGAK